MGDQSPENRCRQIELNRSFSVFVWAKTTLSYHCKANPGCRNFRFGKTLCNFSFITPPIRSIPCTARASTTTRDRPSQISSRKGAGAF